ncbi:Pre-mRNA-splicing factor ATP-dependent RNA helicase dhx15 [Geranomyces michiganensis]|nr:Pre-mRNA-splicing factor ATP-dependent RNA helicase dhx15 [Geranomyces michiganensis]
MTLVVISEFLVAEALTVRLHKGTAKMCQHDLHQASPGGPSSTLGGATHFVAADRSRILILTGETGSGKTTQVLQFLLYDDLPQRTGRRIVCTQPLRLAVTGAAGQVAQELDVDLGAEVGYSIRYEDAISDKTAVVFMTDGRLLQEVLHDPTMQAVHWLYSQWTKVGDPLELGSRYFSVTHLVVRLSAMGAAPTLPAFTGLETAQARPDLRIVIMSATLDADKFVPFFNAPLLSFPGRSYHVDIRYLAEPTANYVDAAVDKVREIHASGAPGDILVFMPGEKGVNATVKALRDTAGLESLPLYSQLPQEAQERFRAGIAVLRRVIVAANIAEASKSHAELKEGPTPELMRIDLTGVLMQLRAMNVEDIVHFDFVDPPAPESMMRALENVLALG